MEERISREELVKRYNVEIHFFDELVDYGLLRTQTDEDVHYLGYAELPAFERFANWHYDLGVNLPGIEMLNDVLQKLELLRAENRRLANRQFALRHASEDFFEDEF